jgi:hypothetical protein
MFMDTLRNNPWLIVILLGILAPLFGIVFGTVSGYLAAVK